MSSNCKEFNFLIDRKSLYTSNDIPALVAYNKCLVNEINALEGKTDSLEESLRAQSSELIKIKSSLEGQEKLLDAKFGAFTSHFDRKVEVIAEVQEQSVDNFTSMFEAYKGGYTDHLSAINFILACAGVVFFVGLSMYKKREIDQLKDDALERVKDTLQTEGLVRNLVESSLTDKKVTELLDTRLNTIAEGLEQQIINSIKDKELYNRRSTELDDCEDSNLSDIIFESEPK